MRDRVRAAQGEWKKRGREGMKESEKGGKQRRERE